MIHSKLLLVLKGWTRVSAAVNILYTVYRNESKYMIVIRISLKYIFLLLIYYLQHATISQLILVTLGYLGSYSLWYRPSLAFRMYSKIL